jgi:ubiquinol-cytochrome c reductase cytochrome c subunit
LNARRENAVKIFLIAVVLLACAAPASAQPQQHAQRSSAANGRDVYMRVGCFTCHGTVGQGGAGARLAPGTLPLGAFVLWVRNGTPGWTIARGMPAFPADVVSDGELADIRAFLASLPAPPAVQDIPLFKE